MKSRAVLVAVLFAATPALFAQEDKKAPPGAEMPDPKHKEHDALKALVGSWDVVMKSEAMPGVPGMEEPTESRGTEHAELICNGLWLRSVVRATYQGKPFEGVWLAGYDPHEKSYISVWVCSDDEQGGACSMDGAYDAKSKTWTWSGTTPHGEMRSVYAFKSADHSVETCYMKTPDGGEMPCMEITRKRSRAPVAVDASAVRPKGLAKEQELLLKDVGVWDATVKTTMPGQEPTVDPATERVTTICDGRWLWSDFTGRFMGMPFEGHALVGYDPNEKKYVSYWIDSMSSTWGRTSGTYDARAKAYRLQGTSVDPAGNEMEIREVLTWKDDDTRVLQMEFESEGQVSEMEITYKRKKK